MSFKEPNPLLGKLALITGCSGGIGKATALRLANQGCSVAVHYNSAKSAAEQLVQELTQLNPSIKAAAFQADLRDYNGVRKLHQDVVNTLGHPDILFNNAGATFSVVGPQGDIQAVSVEEFEQTWKMNTGSGYLLTQLCLPAMLEKKYGRVVFCSSIAAGTGGVIGPHYASSKSALHGLLHWIAMRYAKEGITCNAVAPGLITETGMFSNPSEELRARLPVGRFGRPDEIASIVEMLVLNSYMTNKIIVADGGAAPSAF
ncbi:NAD-binding protein [Panaeolus papilionaceus]|nr:NAD-binding protein [Panaeolus papilionaceus]